MVAVDTRIVLAGWRLCGNSVSHSWTAIPRLDLSLAIDRHDDLVRVSKLRLDVVVVRRRNRHRRHDHLYVCSVREETQRGVTRGRWPQRMGSIKKNRSYSLFTVPSAKGAEYDSQGQAPSRARRVAPGQKH